MAFNCGASHLLAHSLNDAKCIYENGRANATKPQCLMVNVGEYLLVMRTPHCAPRWSVRSILCAPWNCRPWHLSNWRVPWLWRHELVVKFNGKDKGGDKHHFHFHKFTGLGFQNLEDTPGFFTVQRCFFSPSMFVSKSLLGSVECPFSTLDLRCEPWASDVSEGRASVNKMGTFCRNMGWYSYRIWDFWCVSNLYNETRLISFLG